MPLVRLQEIQAKGGGGMTEKPRKKLTKRHVLIFLLIGVPIGTILGMLSAFTAVHMQFVGCDGIERFYTGTGFYEDMDLIQTISTQEFKSDYAKDPLHLYDEGGDCESISNAIRCLGQLYGIECRYYTLFEYDYTRDDPIVGHLGVKCNMSGYWEVMN